MARFIPKSTAQKEKNREKGGQKYTYQPNKVRIVAYRMAKENKQSKMKQV